MSPIRPATPSPSTVYSSRFPARPPISTSSPSHRAPTKVCSTAGPAGTGNTKLANGLSAAGQGISNALDNVLRVRAQFGASLKQLDTLDSVGQDKALQYKQTLATLQDVDYAKAASDMARQQVALQAAQKTFVNTEGLSLFNYIQ